ncbi:hypothetical protein V8304_004770 [Escherichia coli]
MKVFMNKIYKVIWNHR